MSINDKTSKAKDNQAFIQALMAVRHPSFAADLEAAILEFECSEESKS
ncbi:MAG TPA: hypothetical protein VNS88_07010 [Nitrospiraceae bacterium]|nr:hypothetical protein [Nitrospiraceae bacterium]